MEEIAGGFGVLQSRVFRPSENSVVCAWTTAAIQVFDAITVLGEHYNYATQKKRKKETRSKFGNAIKTENQREKLSPQNKNPALNEDHHLNEPFRLTKIFSDKNRFYFR